MDTRRNGPVRQTVIVARADVVPATDAAAAAWAAHVAAGRIGGNPSPVPPGDGRPGGLARVLRRTGPRGT